MAVTLPRGAFDDPASTTRLILFARALVLALCLLPAAHAGNAPQAQPPRWLSETGLFVDGPDVPAPGVLQFAPQYPLWTDGASKRRWIWLPPGTAIDAARPDDWVFPVGTKLWKEFSFAQRVETRMSERLADGSWRFAVYVWKVDGRDAELGPDGGVRNLQVAGAPGRRYTVPSKSDCAACHESSSVLGFSALQLSPDRDPLAPHAEPAAADALDLRTLHARGLLLNLPTALLDQPPRIAAVSPVERAALGYLHGNCGHCHIDPRESDSGVPLDLMFKQYVARPDCVAAVRASIFNTTSRFRARDANTAERANALTLRMRSRDPRVQMPPLGTQVSDSVALSLIERWISNDHPPEKGSHP